MSTANIAAALERECCARPAEVVVRSPTGGRDTAGARNYRNVTFGELQQRIRHLTAAVAEIGIGPGCRCALMVPPSVEFIELTFALFAAGAVPVFVDPGIGLRNLKACLATAAPQAFIGITKAHVARLLFGWAKATLRTHVTVGPKLGWSGHTLEQLRSMSPATADIQPTTADTTAAILFTSGSTGVPKGAVYTHGMFLAQLEKLQRAFDIQPGEIDLCTFPLFALFGPALGMTSVIPVMDATRPAKVDPREVIEPIRRLGATNIFGSPALLNRVARSKIASSADGSSAPLLPTIKRVLSAGAPVSGAILERFQRLLPAETQIFTPYGATEALPVAVIGSHEILRETRQQTLAGRGTCVGRPVAGLDVRIIHVTDEPIAQWKDDLEVPRGTIGEIVVHGPQVTQEYFARPELTAIAKIPDPSRGRAWHRMGDVGYFDELGRLWFCGRKSQRVTTTDGVLYTEPVEGVFNGHPRVFRTALVGVPRQGDKLPVLCVECEADVPRSEQPRIREELLELGARHEVTRRVQTILFRRDFPVDIRHNSKIFREQLAVWAARTLR